VTVKPVTAPLRVLALAGGVGGAKLASGLAQILGERLTVLVNTGDDFEHLGLHISPDLDTVMYTLAGIASPETGWGLAGETWSFMEQVKLLGGQAWFRLGDRDLATHVIRTELLNRGKTLTAVTAHLCRALGVRSVVLPMSDHSVRTIVHSGTQKFSFQEYFVRLKCDVSVSALSFEGAPVAKINAALAGFRTSPEALAIVICPSNPYLSIDPILALPGFREWIKGTGAPVVAVSPIVGGKAIKGPAEKIMRELGVDPSAVNIGRHYGDLINGLVIDAIDSDSMQAVSASGVAVLSTQTVMRTAQDRVDLARDCLAFIDDLLRRKA
jgi:LPPG:FO 2-phospho-L-lactate transferase